MWHGLGYYNDLLRKMAANTEHKKKTFENREATQIQNSKINRYEDHLLKCDNTAKKHHTDLFMV